MYALEQDFSLGEPQLAGPLAVYPVFGPPARFSYRAFVQAIDLGATVRELEQGALVGQLLVENPTELPLLAYEGEEVLGAQQNRSFDMSALVPAGERLELPVSCVERGRWDGARRHEPFRPSPQSADPALRRAKRIAAERHGRADQGEVWAAVDGRLADHGVESATDAMSDLYDMRRSELGALAGSVEHREGQTGALACVSGRPLALDLVSRADVFAALLGPLAQGYALQALGRPTERPDDERAAAFLEEAVGVTRYELPTPGLGRAFAARSRAVVGAGLEHAGELVQLSSFPAAV